MLDNTWKDSENKDLQLGGPFMARMKETCNHVAAAMYRVEAAVRIGLTNTVCTSNAKVWLPNGKTIEPKKIKDLNFSGEDFG